MNTTTTQILDNKIEKSPYPAGIKGARISMEKISQRVAEAMTNPKDIVLYRSYAGKILRDAGNPETSIGQAQAILDHVKKKVQWVRDPVGVEMIQAAKVTLCLDERVLCIPIGDCDDLVTLVITLLMCIGINCKIIAQAFENGAIEPTHVILAIQPNENPNTWVKIDPSVKTFPVGKVHNATKEWEMDPMDKVSKMIERPGTRAQPAGLFIGVGDPPSGDVEVTYEPVGVGAPGAPGAPSRASCLECVQKHLGSARVLIEEVNDGYPHETLVVGHLNEAASEAQAWPQFRNAIREARKAYQQHGTIPDFEKLEKMMKVAGKGVGVSKKVGVGDTYPAASSGGPVEIGGEATGGVTAIGHLNVAPDVPTILADTATSQVQLAIYTLETALNELETYVANLTSARFTLRPGNMYDPESFPPITDISMFPPLGSGVWTAGMDKVTSDLIATGRDMVKAGHEALNGVRDIIINSATQELWIASVVTDPWRLHDVGVQAGESVFAFIDKEGNAINGFLDKLGAVVPAATVAPLVADTIAKAAAAAAQVAQQNVGTQGAVGVGDIKMEVISFLVGGMFGLAACVAIEKLIKMNTAYAQEATNQTLINYCATNKCTPDQLGKLMGVTNQGRVDLAKIDLENNKLSPLKDTIAQAGDTFVKVVTTVAIVGGVGVVAYFAFPYIKEIVAAHAEAVAAKRGTRGAKENVYEHDEHAEHELELYMDNDEPLYRRKLEFIRAVKRKINAGRYDASKAWKLWLYWVDEAARKYVREFGGSVRTMFPKELREHLAKEIAKYEYEAIMRGEYHAA